MQRLIEKPQAMENNLAVVGFYYFQSAEELLSAIEEQMRRDLQLKGEFFLADAVNIMLERGLKMRTEQVDVWLDAGTPEALLETNRYLLSNGRSSNSRGCRPPRCGDHPAGLHPPHRRGHQFDHRTLRLPRRGCCVERSILRNSILEDEAARHRCHPGELTGRSPRPYPAPRRRHQRRRPDGGHPLNLMARPG